MLNAFVVAWISLAILSGCDRPDIIVDLSDPAGSSEDFVMMAPAYYRYSDDGNTIQVRFYDSPRIFELSNSTHGFQSFVDKLDSAIATKQPLWVNSGSGSGGFATINSIVEADAPELRSYWSKHNIFSEPDPAPTVIMSMELLSTIFDYCATQGCTTDESVIDHCITYQYVHDGCFARAHKMRQIMLQDFNVVSEKVFSYEGPTGTLAVDAGDCCVYWWFHVAPLVSVMAHDGQISKWVIDPSMFSEPVSIDTWTAAQENFSCTPLADFGHYEITPGAVYLPNGTTDQWCLSTNLTLMVYRELETCY